MKTMSKQAFDSVSEIYDEAFSATQEGVFLREKVRRLSLDFLLPHCSLLEVNCGTGEDAVFFASKGFTVHASDSSEGMIRIARDKFPEAEKQYNLKFFESDLRKLSSKYSYDAIFSNFGGINCLDGKDLKVALSSMHACLKPGGLLFLVVMPPFYLYEWLYFMMRLKIKSAFRRKRAQLVEIRLNHIVVNTWYHSVSDIVNLSSGLFSCQKVEPVGFFVPPPNLSGFLVKKKLVFSFLSRLENSFPFNKFLSGMADHYFICLKKL